MIKIIDPCNPIQEGGDQRTQHSNKQINTRQKRNQLPQMTVR